MKNTKIICTVGPSCNSTETLREMARSGMNAVRLNFSHGNREWHRDCIKQIDSLNRELEFPLSVILDLKGPETRTVLDKGFAVRKGDRVVISASGGDVGLDNPKALPLLQAGDRVLIDDGMIKLSVERAGEGSATCVAENDGTIFPNKSVNFPGKNVFSGSITEKDAEDIRLGLSLGADYVALSFVSCGEDVTKAREIIGECDVQVISKIECAAAVENFDSILKESDAIMIARGDLGVEVDFERIPTIQNEIIRKCNESGKPVIVATHMLNSMIENPRPTRAEVIDVANAVLGGADAVMLSGETAIGKHPVEAVHVMDRIIREAERCIKPRFPSNGSNDVGSIVAGAVARVSDALNARAVLTFTETGNTAKTLSSHRIKSPVFAFTTSESLRRKHSLFWGNYFYVIEEDDLEDMIARGIDILKSSGSVRSGDVVVLTAGVIDKGNRNVAEVRVIE